MIIYIIYLNNLMKKRILFEDATMYYNKWVQGMASGQLASQKVGLKDILSQNDEHLEQSPNQRQDNNVMPYPVPNAVSVLGDLITSLSNNLTLFRQTLKNPVLEKDKYAKAEIILIITVLKKALNLLNGLIYKLQKSVEVKDKQSK
jgi:hypothetical protein